MFQLNNLRVIRVIILVICVFSVSHVEAQNWLELSRQTQRMWFGNSRPGQDMLIGRAVLPAATFSEGPTSGQYIGQGPINGQEVPFINKQPVQGFSSVLYNGDGTFWALSDNGFGGFSNSADYNLRIYRIRPNFETANGGEGTVDVLEFIELSDPNYKIDFPIVNHFTEERVLTGADFDIESIQITPDGTIWIGDEFGPFLLHFDSDGKMIDAPIALPDFENEGKELRAPQNPYNEEGATLRIMNAVRTHAQINGSTKTPVFSPWFVMLADNNPETFVNSRLETVAPGLGLEPASSEIHNVRDLSRAGFPVVPYTINDADNMKKLIELNVDGIISDSPDTLYMVASTYDGNNDGTPDFVDADGLLDINKIDAQGHRGARNLRPENTLPSMEAALDYLMTTLETDCAVTKDGIAVLSHDPHIEAARARKADGTPYERDDEVLFKDLTLAEIQSTFIADKLASSRPTQTNDLSLSPVAVAFADAFGMPDPYVHPSLQQLFFFVNFYQFYYQAGPGKNHPDATRRWKNAARIRFNIETKINPRTDMDDRGDIYAERTVSPEEFTDAVARTIIINGLSERADIQSFDFRTLLLVHEKYPTIRTVFLFGDFPRVEVDGGIAGDGTNMQDQAGENTPWMAGLFWPYRSTALNNPQRVRGSGGFEGMALTTDGKTLLPLLEKAIIGKPGVLLINEFDVASKSYTGKQFEYVLDERGSAIGDFVMFTKKRGLIIERDGSQGDLNGFKRVFEITLNEANGSVNKELNVDLLRISDPNLISEPGREGDVGLGSTFAFPFVTIESVVVLDRFTLGILNDNNYPFSRGRNDVLVDDNEFILIFLDEPLFLLPGGFPFADSGNLTNFPNPFAGFTQISYEVPGAGVAKITIKDASGNVLKTFVKKHTKPGSFDFMWDGKDRLGRDLNVGVYFCTVELNGGDVTMTRRMLKIR